ncbi:hypothetical protein ACHWQZ_G016345 [Mnemiopsis leidyi]
MDHSTFCFTAADTDGTYWFKITFKNVNCIERVIWFPGGDVPVGNWTCTDSQCGDCEGEYCGQFTVSVEGAVSGLTPVSDCKFGDTVRIDRHSNNGFYVHELVVIQKQGIRQRVAGELTPEGAEQSATKEDDEEQYGAGNAIDMDLETWSYTLAASDGTSWLKMTLDKVRCIEKGIWHTNTGQPLHTWTCTDSHCNNCEGSKCSDFTLTVSSDGAASDFPSFTDCKYGDSVKLEGVEGFAVRELAIIGKQEADCTTHDSTWSNVVTVPALPVVHGTTLTLNCPGGYTNLGGNTATCLYGQVVPTNQSPNCRAARELVANEIKPASAEQSATHQDYVAGNAIDMVLGTWTYTLADSDGFFWLKINLANVRCIKQVIWLGASGAPVATWNCQETGCSSCEGPYCSQYSLIVSTEGVESDPSPASDCDNKYGDTVMIKTGSLFYVHELVVVGKPEPECTTHDSTWSNVVTVPALPVVHGTTMTLNCPGGYTNLGGNTATCLYGQVLPTNQPPNCRVIRERVANEIIPDSVEQSATGNNNFAGNAIDLDLGSHSRSIAGSDGRTWLKITLDKVNCVKQVIRYYNDGTPILTWTCNGNNCSYCKGKGNCESFILKVSTKGAEYGLPPVSVCRYGDTVELERVVDNELTVVEIAVIGEQEADCTTHDSTWSNVVTVPALPVVHGTTLTLNCPGGYTNLGGNTATCLYGQVVPTNQPPNCRGKKSL